MDEIMLGKIYHPKEIVYSETDNHIHLEEYVGEVNGKEIFRTIERFNSVDDLIDFYTQVGSIIAEIRMEEINLEEEQGIS